MNQQLKRKLDDLQRIVRDYPKLKDKIGKKKILQRIKIRLRSLPDNETKAMIAFQTISKLNPYHVMSNVEVVRRIECLTDLSAFEINTVISHSAKMLIDAGIVRESANDAEYSELRRKESVIDPEDAVINEYCEVELKRRYQSDFNDFMGAYA